MGRLNNTRGIKGEFKPLAQAAMRAGWDLTQTAACHVKWVSPCGTYRKVTALTSSNHSAAKRHRLWLREAGVEV